MFKKRQKRAGVRDIRGDSFWGGNSNRGGKKFIKKGGPKGLWTRERKMRVGGVSGFAGVLLTRGFTMEVHVLDIKEKREESEERRHSRKGKRGE